jgi:predicted nucleotide-binding protein (sugar kinase/HSP70/actin superfamily)
MKLTLANWGYYSICFKNLMESLGIEVILPEKTTPKAIEEGAKISPDLFCFPLKVNIGNYLSAIRKGADTIFMWENIGGSCRLRYYWIIQEKALREAGFKATVLNINARNFFPILNKIRKENKISIFGLVRSFLFFIRQIWFIEKTEKKVRYLRPRELESGRSDQILIKTLDDLDKVVTARQLMVLERKTEKALSDIQIDKNRKVLKIGLVGEIYTVVDGTLNFDLEKKLGQMEIEVCRQMNLLYHLKKTIFPWIDWKIQKKIMPYLKSTVGGHGRDAIYELLEYSKEGFDGVIQLLPFGCMPETTVRPILQNISKEKGIHFISFSIDEQTGEVGVSTRLEAFVDLIKNKQLS